MSHIVLYIEELKLQHLIPAHHERIRAAVEQELQQLLAERGLSVSRTHDWRTPLQVPRTHEYVTGHTAESLGTQIARQAYEGLHQEI